MMFHFIVSFSYNIKQTFKYLCIRISNFYHHMTVVANLIDPMVMGKEVCVAIRNSLTCTVHIQRIFNPDSNTTNTRWEPKPKPIVRVTCWKNCVNLCQNKCYTLLFHLTNIPYTGNKHYCRCDIVLTAICRRLSLYITNSPDKEAVQSFPSKVNILGSVEAEQTLFAIFLSSSKRKICG